MPTANPYRLARTVVPKAYRIFLTPDIDHATFAGRVEIDVDVAEATDTITLNAIELTLGAATLTGGGQARRSREPVFDEVYETAAFPFDEGVPAGPATLEIAFSGVLNDLLHGFYRSTYVDAQGETRLIATTQLQESDARRVFPCFDEPSFKATFTTTLTVPSHLSAYSNSAVVEDVDLGNGLRTVSFGPTMKMSSYLNAFIVGPFEATEPVESVGVPIRVVHPVGKSRLAAFALEAAVGALRFYTDYFAIPYPSEKLDLVAIPDFAFGAMENQGCVTFREVDLLIDAAGSSLAERRRVVKVVAHEIAHMWFGNLVTMDWWEGIWLNEAFATFMEVLCSDALHPEWQPWTDQAVNRELAMRVDGLNTTRPIEFPVLAPKESLAMVDFLTYEKGASVLWMLEQFLGPEVYRDAIRVYLKRHSYANTVTTDLWDALEEVSGLPVRTVMNTWIYQGGSPVVRLDAGVLTQAPFHYGERAPATEIGEAWHTPVLVRSLDGGEERHLLADEPERLSLDGPVVVNAGGSGYYRVSYDAESLAAIAGRLGELSPPERVTLVGDTWGLVYASQAPWSQFDVVVEGLAGIDEPFLWGGLSAGGGLIGGSVASAASWVRRALTPDRRPGLAAWVRRHYSPILGRLGWEPRDGEDDLTRQMRGIAISTLGSGGEDAEVRAEAVRRFEAGDYSGDLASPILRVVAANGDPAHYRLMLERFHAAPTPQDEQRYLYMISAFDSAEVVEDLMPRCFDGEIRSQDAPAVLLLMMAMPEQGPAAWRYFTSRWDEALTIFPAYLHPRLTWGVATYITDPAFADEVEAFHRSHEIVGQQKQVDQQIELMRVGLAFTRAIRTQF